MSKYFAPVIYLCLFTVAAAQDRVPEPQRTEGQGRVQWTPRVGGMIADVWGKAENDEGPTELTAVEGTGISIDDELELGDDLPAAAYIELVKTYTQNLAGETHTYELMNLSFFIVGFEEETVLEANQTFNGRTFAAGATIESEFDLWVAGLDWSLMYGEVNSKVEGEIFVGIRYWDSVLSIEDVAAGTETDESLRVGLVGVGFGGRWHLFSKFAVHLRLGGYISAWVDDEDDNDDYEMGAVHAEGMIALGFTVKRFEARLGLRYITASASIIREDSDSYEEYDLSWTVGGPFIDISVSF